LVDNRTDVKNPEAAKLKNPATWDHGSTDGEIFTNIKAVSGRSSK